MRPPIENPKVQAYFDQKADDRSRPILEKLRAGILQSGIELEETTKWGAPTYLHHGMVCSMAVFRNHTAIWYHQGALLKDPYQLLISAQEKTKGLRQIRFTDADQVDIDIIAAYTREAAENNAAGKKMKPQSRPWTMPEALSTFLEEHPEMKARFEAMAPSHQREYAEHISEAKRPDTVQRRLEKVKAMILDGKDLNHKYKS